MSAFWMFAFLKRLYYIFLFGYSFLIVSSSVFAWLKGLNTEPVFIFVDAVDFLCLAIERICGWWSAFFVLLRTFCTLQVLKIDHSWSKHQLYLFPHKRFKQKSFLLRQDEGAFNCTRFWMLDVKESIKPAKTRIHSISLLFI